MADEEKKKPAKSADKGGEKPAKAPKAEKVEKAPKAEKAEKGGEKPAAAAAPEAAAEKKPVNEKAAKAKADAAAAKAAKAAEAEKAAAEKPGKGEKKAEEPEAPAPPPRLFERYKSDIRPKLKAKRGYPNDMAVPKITKVVISMGVGAALQNPKRIEEAQKHLTQLAGQKAVVTKARLSIANFKLREGQAIGCKVTLRRARMYEFLDRLISIAIPRIRDFRGLSPKQFDGRGNFSLGVAEQVVFPEIDATRVEFAQGMNIAICTTAKTNEEAHELLHSFGFPFRPL